jgi:hypothetical protein
MSNRTVRGLSVAAVQHQSCLDRAALARGPAARHVPHDTETGRPEVAGQIAGQDRLLRLEHADHGQRLRPTCCRRWRGGRAVSGRGHPPEGHGLAVALRARVRRDRLLAFACRRAVGRDLHPQRRWEALPAMTCAPRRPAAKAQPLRIYVLANLPSVPSCLGRNNRRSSYMDRRKTAAHLCYLYVAWKMLCRSVLSQHIV